MRQNVKEVAVKYAAKLVYAEDDAEFEEIKTGFFNALDEETEYSKYIEYCINEWDYRITEGGNKIKIFITIARILAY